MCRSLFALGRFRLRSWLLAHLGVGTMKTIIANGKIMGEIGYWDGPSHYRMRFPLKIGPSGILRVVAVPISNNINEWGSDITAEYLELAGSGKNFGGVPLTVRDFGWDRLFIETIDGEEHYRGIDPIVRSRCAW